MTSKQHVEMKRMWDRGCSVKRIAWKLGLKICTVQGHAAYYRDEFPARRRCRHITDEEARQMKRMRDEGATYKEISTKFGCTQETASRNVKRVS